MSSDAAPRWSVLLFDQPRTPVAILGATRLKIHRPIANTPSSHRSNRRAHTATRLRPSPASRTCSPSADRDQARCAAAASGPAVMSADHRGTAPAGRDGAGQTKSPVYTDRGCPGDLSVRRHRSRRAQPSVWVAAAAGACRPSSPTTAEESPWGAAGDVQLCPRPAVRNRSGNCHKRQREEDAMWFRAWQPQRGEVVTSSALWVLSDDQRQGRAIKQHYILQPYNKHSFLSRETISKSPCSNPFYSYTYNALSCF